MSYTEISTSHGLTQERWESDLYKEYLGEFPFFDLMGTSSDSVIQVKEDLTKNIGDAITIGIRAKLSGDGQSGTSRLKGNEEQMEFFNQRIEIDELRHGVLLKGKMSQKRVAFNLRNEAKDALKDWLKEKTEIALISAISDVTTGRVQGRYLYGAANGNWNSTHATAQANVDATNDIMTLAMISIAKRKSKLGTGIKMRPFKIKDSGRVIAEKLIMFIHDYAARDLKADTNWSTIQNNMITAGKYDVPLISGSNFLGEYDGVLIYAYDRVEIDTGAGAGGIDIAHNLLLGAQAAAIVWGERTTWAEDIDDYNDENGFKIGEVRGIEKLVFNRDTAEDHGVVHVYSAAVADA